MTGIIYSSVAQLNRLAAIINCCCRLPMSNDAVPGAFLETVLAHIRDSKVLATYDYVDVVDEKNQVGWSIKSTKSDTPITWKRAKIAGKTKLISDSRISKEGIQELGNALIIFCNDHAKASMKRYNLSQIGYCRLIVHNDFRATYFERLLCTTENPDIFNPEDFEWDWSVEKSSKRKEQLSALHGWHRPTGKRWWAWHGLGENQLHFTGEKEWWPTSGEHCIKFDLPKPESKIDFDTLLKLLDAA